jgi:hypothetical protein
MKQMFCGNDGQLSIRRVMAAILFVLAIWKILSININAIDPNAGSLILTILAGVFSLLGLTTLQNVYAPNEELQSTGISEQGWCANPSECTCKPKDSCG